MFDWLEPVNDTINASCLRSCSLEQRSNVSKLASHSSGNNRVAPAHKVPVTPSTAVNGVSSREHLARMEAGGIPRGRLFICAAHLQVNPAPAQDLSIRDCFQPNQSVRRVMQYAGLFEFDNAGRSIAQIFFEY